MSMEVKLVAGTLPPGYCVKDIQEFYNLMFGQAYGLLLNSTGFAKIIVSATEPTADQQDYIWMRINPNTKAYDKTYNYLNGKWVSPYRVPPLSSEAMWWRGDVNLLKTYDGGADEPIADARGPFWEPDPDMYGRFPLGAGLQTDAKTTLDANVKGGNASVVLTKPKLPKIKLSVDLPLIGASGVGSPPVVDDDFGSTEVPGPGRAIDSTTDTDISNRYKPKGQTEELGADEALDIMPPYGTGFWARRTSRIYWTPV